MTERKCTNCRVIKPIASFDMKKNSKVEYNNMCRSCLAYMREYKKNNRAYFTEKNREYIKKHKDKAEKYRREYRSKHRNKLNKYMRGYKKANRIRRINSKTYIRQLLCSNTQLSHSDIPDDLVEIKHTYLMIKRLLKERAIAK